MLNPALFLTSDFMVDSFNEQLLPQGAAVLDMGTGSGVGAVFASDYAQKVTAVDLNPTAVRCARINVLLNEVESQVTVLEGDLFAPVAGQRFDVVIFNPPYLRGEPQSLLDQALRATDVVERFAAALPHHLQPGGHALVLLSSLGDEAAFLKTFREQGLAVAVAARRDLPGEVLTLYQLRLQTEPAPAEQAR